MVVIICLKAINMEEEINITKRKSIKKTFVIALVGVLSTLPLIKASPFMFQDRGIDALEISKDAVEPKVALVARDHGTATVDEVVNVVYGTGATPPGASTTTEGTLYVRYTA